jgi:copper chaperone CopZ
MRDTLKSAIEGMHYEACVRRVTAVLQNVKGVELGSVDVVRRW